MGGDYDRDVYGLWLDDRGMCVCVVIWVGLGVWRDWLRNFVQ